MTRSQVIAGVAFAPALRVVPGLRAEVGVQETLHLYPVKDLTPILNGREAQFVAAEGQLIAVGWTGRHRFP